MQVIGPVVEPRSCCPVSCTLDLLGDRWTLLVLRDAFAGKTRFAEFQRSPERIASNILTVRLTTLTAAGVLERVTASGSRRAEYRLTELGKSLGPVLAAVARWGLDHIEGTEALMLTPPAPET